MKGDYKGLYAAAIIDRHRLIFSLKGESREIVFIEDVSSHYGD